MIREARLEDVNRIGELMGEFTQESLGKYDFDINLEHCKNIAINYLDSTLICEIDNNVVGVLAGEVKENNLDGSKVYHELAWYVKKPYRKYGISLLRELEKKCKDWGVSHIIVGLMENYKADKLTELYKRMGYVPMERHLIKTIGGGNGSPTSKAV